MDVVFMSLVTYGEYPITSQLAFTCSKSTMETPEDCGKSV